MKVAARPTPVNTAPKNLISAEDADEEKELSDSDPTWGRREAARLRQIMIGKARPEYRRYIAEIPADKRDPSQPTTPDPRARVSKRQFDRSLGEWRRRLHEFDTAPTADNSASVRSGEPTKPPGNGGSPSKHGDSANRKSTSQRRPHASRTERQPTGRTATARVGGQEDDGDDSAGIVRLRLAEQLPEMPVPRVAWTLADKLADQVVSLADKLPDPVMPQQSRLALRAGPQQPEDKHPPPFPLRDEKMFPEAGAVKNGEFRFDLVKDVAQYIPVDPIKMADVLGSPCAGRLRLPAEYAQSGEFDDGEESVSSSSPRFVAPPSHTGSPHTPPRQSLIVSPPASVEATPPRVVWAMDTPSPERMYQMMPPPPVLNLANMGQICELGWMGKSST